VYLEIERRFLVDKNNFILPDKKKHIKQGYLLFDDNQVLRIRKIDNDFYLTYKYKKTNINRLEFEYKVPDEDGRKLLSLSKYFIIDKDRYYYRNKGHIWEVDIFHGENKGLMIAEIELNDENEKIQIPSCVGKEISNDDRYLNFNLSINPYSTW